MRTWDIAAGILIVREAGGRVDTAPLPDRAEAHRLLYRSKVGLDHARELLRAGGHLVPAVNHLLSFLENQYEGRNGRGRDKRRAA